MFNLVSTRIPGSFSSFYLGSPQHVLVPGVISSEEQDITILLVEIHEFPIISFLHSRSLWISARSSGA